MKVAAFVLLSLSSFPLLRCCGGIEGKKGSKLSLRRVKKRREGFCTRMLG